MMIKDQNEAKFQYPIKKHEKIGLEEHEHSKAFIKYSNDTQHVYKILKVAKRIENVKH